MLVRADQVDVVQSQLWAHTTGSTMAAIIGVNTVSTGVWLTSRAGGTTRAGIEFSVGGRLEGDAAQRIVMRSSVGGNQPRFGVVLDNAATDTHAAFVWVDGDTQPRVSLGIDNSGRGRLALGPGGGTVPDTNMWRNAGAFESDSVIRVVRAATGQGAFVGRVSGDSQDRLIITADGEVRTGTGAATPVRVVGQRATGYTAMTGTANRGTSYATGTITLVQLAERVKAIQDDLSTTGHGLIGP
jgi:hypothetical protein